MDEESDPYHFGLSLIGRIHSHPRQEIATHTFSHFYCMEEGAGVDALRTDLEAARAAAGAFGIGLTSIVFPRNQIAGAQLSVCRDLGFRAFRGNQRAWIYRPRREAEQGLLARGLRLADSYVPMFGAHDQEPSVVDGMVDVSASVFLRPVTGNAALERLRLARIKAAMEVAARRQRLFHLWWHPHNFGVRREDNLAFLGAILDHFRALQDRYGMRSMTMAAVADEVLDGRGAAHH
jgi:hypothetical protein